MRSILVVYDLRAKGYIMKIITKEQGFKYFSFSATRLGVVFIFLIGIFFSAGCSSGGGGGGARQ